jgi:hypothetical protein
VICEKTEYTSSTNISYRNYICVLRCSIGIGIALSFSEGSGKTFARKRTILPVQIRAWAEAKF